MRTTAIVVASALLLAYFVTETTTRLWPGNYTALLLVALAAFIVHGFFTARVTARGTTDQVRPKRSQPQQRKQPDRGEKRGTPRADKPKPQRKDPAPRAAKKPAAPKAPRPQAPAPDGPTEQGEVKWFNRSKGYGFIIRENGEEIFVHQRSVVGSGDKGQRPVLRDGQKVSFVVTKQDKGAQAEHVQPVD